jgi:heme/copper-type cytochrome/quinol oxidase subunit 4
MTATPDRAPIAVRGTLIAFAVAAVLGAVVFAGVMLISAKSDDALRAAGYVAVVYLVLNLTVLGIGLLARPSAAWAVGAALATPVILAAFGFGYTIFLAKPL